MLTVGINLYHKASDGYRAIMFLVVLYGCETWSLTLTEKCRMRVFENRVLRSKSEVGYTT